MLIYFRKQGQPEGKGGRFGASLRQRNPLSVIAMKIEFVIPAQAGIHPQPFQRKPEFETSVFL